MGAALGRSKRIPPLAEVLGESRKKDGFSSPQQVVQHLRAVFGGANG